MKKIFLLVILCGLFSLITNSQGNLQFNQVLNLSFQSWGNNFSVPSGKVWKVENIALITYSGYCTITIGGQQLFVKNTNVNLGGSDFNSLPYWIAGGQTVNFGGSHSGTASVIEFNIVP
jgi:hypothetical protein